jgi:hypothetical protein
MIAGLSDITKGLGLRFNVVALLPAGVLTLFVVLLVASGAPDRAPDLDLLGDRVDDLDGWQGALLFLALVAATLVVQPLQLSLVRLLEGYWGDSRTARIAARPGRTLAARRRAGLERATRNPADREPSVEDEKRMVAATRRLERFYPAEDDLLPTRLGNVLRAAENRAGGRYGLITVVVWPRLYPLLPEGTVRAVDDQRDQLDLAARFCAVCFLAGLISFGLLVTHGWWLLVPVAALVLAWASYRAAVAAALQYGVGLETAFDLHRFELLRALHLELPADHAAEVATNQELSAFLLQGPAFATLRYEHGKDAELMEAAGQTQP